MSFASHHRIIGVKLITMDDQELEPAADVEWSLDIWRADGMRTTGDRTFGAGSTVERGDADFRMDAGRIIPRPRSIDVLG